MKSKVLVVNGGSYYRPFIKFGSMTENPKILDYTPEEIKLLVLTGGSDVDPKFYGDKKCEGTYSYPERDRMEQEVYMKAKDLGIPMFGICRGLQFQCAMAGGRLVQHLDHHGGRNHSMTTSDGKVFPVNSLHHQMILPGKIDHIVLAWADPKLSKYYFVGKDEDLGTVPYEYEAAAFPLDNACGVQYHPEMMPVDSEGAMYAVMLAEKLISGEFNGVKVQKPEQKDVK